MVSSTLLFSQLSLISRQGKTLLIKYQITKEKKPFLNFPTPFIPSTSPKSLLTHKQRKMNPRSQPRLQWLLFLKLFLVSLFLHFHTSYGDVGTAALYSPPYLHTACYGSDVSQFPSSNLFAAAGGRIWDNGAVCGRQYLVRCITSTSTPDACNQNQTILIKIVDYMGRPPFAHSTYNTTMVLSNTAFGTIANSSTASSYINIEFEHSEARRPLNSSMKMEGRKNQYVANKGDIPAGPYSPPSDPRVHGEDVPLVRGLVPPSAPNPTTDDASGHP